MNQRLHVYLLCFILTLGGLSAVAQQYDNVSWGPSLDDQKGVTIMSLFGTEPNAFYTLQRSRRKRDGYTILKLDSDSLNIIEKSNFMMEEIDGLRPELISVKSMVGYNYLIASTEDSDENTIRIYAYRINLNTSITEQPILLATGSSEAVEEGGNIRVYVSQNKTRMTVIVPTEHLEGRNEKFHLYLYNPALEQIKSKHLEVPHPSEELNYVDAVVDSSGGVFVLASITDTHLESLNKDRNIGKNYALFHYNWETEALTEKSLSLGLKWLYDVRLIINKNKNIQVCGYYSNMVDLVLAGTFSVELEPTTGRLLNQGISPFDRDFRSELRPSNNTASDIDAFQLDYIFTNDSNNVMLISEKTYTEVTQNFNPATGSYNTVYIYNFDEILITSMDASSKIEYNIVIPKYQSSSSRSNTYTSFLAKGHNGSVFLFYNDHDRNSGLTINKRRGYRQLTTPSNSQIIMIEIEADGRVIKTPLFTSSSMRASFVPHFSYSTPDGIILLAKSGYHMQFFKISLD